VAGRGSGTADVFGGSASGRFDPPLRAVKEMFLRTDQNAHAVTSEVRILARLQHPNIVRYAESFVERDTVFIVMELASGASLGERVAGFVSAGERAPERFLWDVFSQTCQALRYLHDEAGVIHRDITPSNILVDRDNRRVKLVDFGLAKSLESSSAVSSFASFASIASIASTASVSDPGSAPPRAEPTRDPAARSGVGTMPYSCPEIIKNEPYDAKADVWSFGCVMYHAIALRPPFGGSRSNPLAVASRIVEGRFDPLAGAASGDSAYSDDLIDAVSSMLIVDPASRPSIATVAAGRVHRAMRETDRLREENDALREELTNERRRREFESSMERRRRDAAVTAARLGFDGFGRIEAPRDSAREALRVDPSGGSEVIRGPQTECSPLSPLALSRGSVKIAPRRLRPVHDPAAEIISALHKLAFADRLPPSAQRDARRASVRRFAAYVFSAARSAGAVKAETVKLARGSPEPTLASSAGGARGAAETYEDVSRALEEVLLEHGYYALARAESR
jgi:NIMA (never in mitosis gene a)-related kinase